MYLNSLKRTCINMKIPCLQLYTFYDAQCYKLFFLRGLSCTIQGFDLYMYISMPCSQNPYIKYMWRYCRQFFLYKYHFTLQTCLFCLPRLLTIYLPIIWGYIELIYFLMDWSCYILVILQSHINYKTPHIQKQNKTI